MGGVTEEVSHGRVNGYLGVFTRYWIELRSAIKKHWYRDYMKKFPKRENELVVE